MESSLNTTTRTQVYLRDGRLFPVTNARPSGRGPWPRVPDYRFDELVAIVEGDAGDIEVKEGPAASPGLVNDSLLLHRGIPPSSLDSSVWNSVPAQLRDLVDSKIQQADDRVSTRLGQYSNEEAVTGALFTQIDDTIRSDGWEVTLTFIEFSKQEKEGLTGSDLAVVLDVLAQDGRRSFKSIWLQAKKSRVVPKATSTFPRMSEQLPRAYQHNQSSYGLVYTPHGAFVLPQGGGEPERLGRLIDDAMQCRTGDQTVGVLKKSLDRKRLEILVTQLAPPAPRRPGDRRMNLRRGQQG